MVIHGIGSIIYMSGIGSIIYMVSALARLHVIYCGGVALVVGCQVLFLTTAQFSSIITPLSHHYYRALIPVVKGLSVDDDWLRHDMTYPHAKRYDGLY